MKRFVFLLGLFFVISCISKEQQEQQANEIAQQQFSEIDFSTPDSYPQFKGCNELENSMECFYEKLHVQIHDKLQLDPLDLQIQKADTLTAIIKVSKKGVVSYVSLQQTDATDYSFVLDSIFSVRLSDLCHVQPALKQGIPIESSYLLPVIIKPTD